MRILNTKVYGLEESLVRAGYPMMTEICDMDELKVNDYDIDFEFIGNYWDLRGDGPEFKRGITLGNAPIGSGHDKFLRGIRVQMDIIAPRYFWQEWDTYHFNESISSQSTMHRITKFNINEMCNPYVDPVILKRFKELLQNYNDNPVLKNFLVIKSNIPEGLEVGRGIDTSYASIKTMYSQRKNHKLPEWSVEFKEWVEELPYVRELGILGGNK
jgi:hypothetical protein